MPESASAPNILAVRFSSIGDVLLTTPLIRAIRGRYPGCRLTVLTKEAYAPLLNRNPHLTEVISLPEDRPLISLAAELRANRYSHLLDLHDSLRSRALRILVPGAWSSYPKHRLARAVLIYTKRNIYHDPRPVPERYFSAARDLDVVPDGGPPELFWGRDEEDTVAAWLHRMNLPEPVRLIALAPGAAHATKRWPLEHWRSLVQRVARECHVVVVGAAEDAPLGAELARVVPDRVLNAAGEFGLQHTGVLLRRASAVVSGDTGVMHLATAVGTPVIALFGPTVRQFGFFPYADRARVVELSLGCRPCTSKGGPRCPLGHHRCLRDLSPELVFEALCRSLG